MTDLLAHRGPDDAGTFIEHGVGLGFRRLSILDLAPSGRQPMHSADGRHVIVFNGEIYNFLELRRELESLGHVFRSSGDTEVLLAAYRQWGHDCLARLNGMWAFVIYDRVERRLFGARDRLGVKPLYCWRDSASIVFTSEIKAIRDSGYAALRPNREMVAAFLLENRVDEDDATLYEQVTRIPAGTAFEVDRQGTMRTWRYWSIVEAAREADCPADPPAAFAELFEDAVRLRLRSDVPVGVMLSGGMDSTSIICSMARQLDGVGGELRAFCYMSSRFDESEFIQATLQQTGAHLLRLDDDPLLFWNELERHLWHQDGPVHSFSAVIGYELMRLARAHGVKVLLNGQGADETCAGYPSYVPQYWLDLVRAGRLWALAREVTAHAREHGKHTGELLWRLAHSLGSRALSNLPGYREAALRRRAARVRADEWVCDEIKAFWRPLEQAPVDSLEESLRWSVEREYLPLYLRVEDHSSMAHGVEVRLPFLDYRLVTLAFRLGAEWKLHGALGKHILREAMRGRIPECVRTRVQKFGFPNGTDEWFRGPLYEPLRDLLTGRVVRESGLWRTERVERALERHRRGEIAVGTRLFDVLQSCIWLEGNRVWPRRGMDRAGEKTAASARPVGGLRELPVPG